VITPRGTYQYVVESTRIVNPEDVGVLRPTARPELTLVTCYPSHYIGSAPQRFVVNARLVRTPRSAGSPAASP
jgi:sortase A